MGLSTNQGRIVADFRGHGALVCLVVYVDESWAILRDGETVLAWEPGGTADCITAFVGMGGFDASVTMPAVAEEQGVFPDCSAPHPPVVVHGRSQLPSGDDYRLN